MHGYTFCEAVRGYVRLHIRKLTERGQQLRKKPDTKALCGMPVTRDSEIAIVPFYLEKITCQACAQAYLDALATEDDGE